MLKGGPKKAHVLLVVAPDRQIANYMLSNRGVDPLGDGWRMIWGGRQLRGWRDGCPVLLPEDDHLAVLLDDGRGGAVFAALVKIVRARLASGRLRLAMPEDIEWACERLFDEGETGFVSGLPRGVWR